VPEIPNSQLLAWERELLGLYLSDHPLSEIIGSGRITGNTLIVELPDRTPGSKVKIVGMLAGIRRITTRSNRTMAIVDLEDLTGNIELVMFPDCYDQHIEVLDDGAILEVTAKLELRNEQLQLVCESATDRLTMAAAKPTSTRTVHVRLRTTENHWEDIRTMQDVIAILKRHEGDDEVQLYLPVGRSWVVFRSRSYRVDWNDVLAAELRRQLGSEHVRFEERKLAS
jgi:DNA polymerase III subunit alpha